MQYNARWVEALVLRRRFYEASFREFQLHRSAPGLCCTVTAEKTRNAAVLFPHKNFVWRP